MAVVVVVLVVVAAAARVWLTSLERLGGPSYWSGENTSVGVDEGGDNGSRRETHFSLIRTKEVCV